MICIECGNEGTKDKHSSDRFPICETCVAEQVAKTKAERLGKGIGVDWQALRAAREEALAVKKAEFKAKHAELVQESRQAIEDSPKMETVYIDVVDAAKMMRKDLKAAFPETKFSVKSERYSGGASINVDWECGPDTHSVDKIIQKYNGASFDGMIDLESPVTHIVDGKRIHYGSKYNFGHRSVPHELQERIIKDFAELTAMDYTGDRLEKVEGHGRDSWNDIYEQLIDRADLNEYHGIRHTGEMAGRLDELYEIY